MKNRKVLVILIVSAIFIYDKESLAADKKSGNLHYTVRFKKISSSEDTLKTWYINDTYISRHGASEYLNGHVYTAPNIVLRKVNVILQKCEKDGSKCEYLMRWSFPNGCSMIFQKEQMWSPFVHSIWGENMDGITKKCRITKTHFEVRNCSLNVDKIISFAGSWVVDHYFKAKIVVYDPKNVKIVDSEVEFTIYAYK